MATPQVPVFELPPEFFPRTISAVLRERASREDGTRRCLLAWSAYDGWVSVTYGEIEAASTRLACGLRDECGIGRGSKVAWLLSNATGYEAICLYHAVLKLGGVNVPINARLATPEIAHILEHSEAEAVVFEASVAGRALAAAGAGVRTIAVGTWPEAGGGAEGRPVLSFADLPRDGDELKPDDDELDEATLMYTSGTTGRPKGVVLTHTSSIASAISWADVFRLVPEDVLQTPFPIFSGAGLHFCWLSSLWAGSTCVLDDYETVRSLEIVREVGTTVYTAVPSIYQFWLESPALASATFPSVRILCFGGASMPASVITRLREAFPTAGLLQTFGLTEGGPGGTYCPEEYALAKLGSIGNRPAGKFTQVRVVDDDGRDVGPDETGELLLRGPSLMQGYYKDPEETAKAFTDGWLRSGDVVRIDRDGFIFHLDRKKDIIVRGGFNISSADVESVLLEHPAIAEAAVVARSHPKLGEEVVAFVVLRPGTEADVDGIREHCKERLADFKVPSAVFFRDDLPRNQVGKILKRELRDSMSGAAS